MQSRSPRRCQKTPPQWLPLANSFGFQPDQKFHDAADDAATASPLHKQSREQLAYVTSPPVRASYLTICRSPLCIAGWEGEDCTRPSSSPRWPNVAASTAAAAVTMPAPMQNTLRHVEKSMALNGMYWHSVRAALQHLAFYRLRHWPNVDCSNSNVWRTLS